MQQKYETINLDPSELKIKMKIKSGAKTEYQDTCKQSDKTKLKTMVDYISKKYGFNLKVDKEKKGKKEELNFWE